MWIYNITYRLRNKAGFRNLSSRNAVAGTKTSGASREEFFLENKNAIISGEFFPDSEHVLKENLLERKVNLQAHLTPETELLICGKYPDWMLITEAGSIGVKIIFVDKASDLFARHETDLRNRASAVPCQEPLGI